MKLDLYVSEKSERCREVRELLESVRGELGFELCEVDIAQNPALVARYHDRVPVVVVDGHPLPGRDVSPSRLLKAVRRRLSRVEGAPRRDAARPLTRGKKLAFAVIAAGALVAVLGLRATQIARQPKQRAERTLGVEPKSGPAPDFALKARDGTLIRLADFKGKTVFLNFWATWCDTCRTEMPSLHQLAGGLRGRDFTMVAASVDDSWEPIQKFFAGREPDFQVLHDPGGQASRSYGTLKFPESYVIGPDGSLIAKFTGPRDWSDPVFEAYFTNLLASLGGRRPPASGQ
jgi:peroxiredoxin